MIELTKKILYNCIGLQPCQINTIILYRKTTLRKLHINIVATHNL